jgi:hypothetical protein
LKGFTVNGHPILDKFLKVPGTFQSTTGASIQSPPTILVHVKLSTIPYTSHFTTTRDLLWEFYHNDNRLLVIDLAFNISTNKAVGKWRKCVEKEIAEAYGYSHVVIFATTHSVPDNGDLWLGEDDEGKRNAINVAKVSFFIFSFYYRL